MTTVPTEMEGRLRPLIQNIFLNPNIVREADRAELEMMSFPVDTVVDALLIATNWNRQRVREFFESSDYMKIRDYLLGNQEDGVWKGSHGDWKKFGVYNTGACRYMAIRSDFLASLKNSKDYPDYFKWACNPNIKKHQLEKISQHLSALDYPNIAWSIKIIALRKGFWDFKGVQANTTPCRKATEFLFNKSYNNDQFGHSLLCQRIATETGTSMMRANSILWAMGQKL